MPLEFRPFSQGEGTRALVDGTAHQGFQIETSSLPVNGFDTTPFRPHKRIDRHGEPFVISVTLNPDSDGVTLTAVIPGIPDAQSHKKRLLNSQLPITGVLFDKGKIIRGQLFPKK